MFGTPNSSWRAVLIHLEANSIAKVFGTPNVLHLQCFRVTCMAMAAGLTHSS